MIHLTMYGQHTSTYEYVKMMLLRNTKKAHIELSLTEVNDWTEIVKQKVSSLPTIRVNNHIDLSYREGQNINEFVHQLVTKILKEENYGEMMKMIVPTDFSDAATNALVYAHNLSKPLNGIIRLVHVYRPDVAHIDNIVVVDKETERVKKKQLENFVNKVNQSWIGASQEFMPMESDFRVGFAIDEIEKCCTPPYDKNILVVGSTGSSNNLKKVFGSISLQLIKKSPSPVLVIPPKCIFSNISNILYAVSNFEKDKLACSFISKFALANQAKIHLVHVNTNDTNYPFEDLISKCKEVDSEISLTHQEIKSKDVVNEIDDYVLENMIDIVSMTTYDRGFLSDLFHVSVTRKMAIHSEVPLLIVHV